MARRWAFLRVIFAVRNDPMHHTNGEHMNLKPEKKVGVGAGAIGIPAGIILAWGLTEFAGINVDETVAVAFGGFISSLAAYLLPS